MKVSDCCGVPAYSNGDSSTEDYGICPECKEHCEYIEELDAIPILPAQEGDLGIYENYVKATTISAQEGKEEKGENRLWIKIGKDIIIEINRNILSENVFSIDNINFMFEITNDDGNFSVTNAVDGWGLNKREEFEKMPVTFLTESSKYFIGYPPKAASTPSPSESNSNEGYWKRRALAAEDLMEQNAKGWSKELEAAYTRYQSLKQSTPHLPAQPLDEAAKEIIELLKEVFHKSEDRGDELSEIHQKVKAMIFKLTNDLKYKKYEYPT